MKYPKISADQLRRYEMNAQDSHRRCYTPSSNRMLTVIVDGDSFKYQHGPNYVSRQAALLLLDEDNVRTFGDPDQDLSAIAQDIIRSITVEQRNAWAAPRPRRSDVQFDHDTYTEEMG